jgi:UDP-N-acetylglucosamine 4,6-dehydratase
MFYNQVILVTGGTGSFGQRFIHRVLTEYPEVKKIIVYSRDEFKQFEMSLKFKDHMQKLRFFIGDVRDAERLKMAMEDVDYVVHAAAMKQVIASEYNPMECIKTNIYGAQNVIDAALACEVQKVIALSTDKAANPINLYGATKLASDKLFVAANNLTGTKKTAFSVVRYGNVVGSRGSVLPYFKQLIDAGETHLPITHPEMTRFWITLDKGVEFVISTLGHMKGGGLYIPKIPSVRVVDLVKSFGPQIGIKIIGIRPGEKLHEIMCTADDAGRTYDFKGYFLIAPAIEFSHQIDFSVDGFGEKAQLVDSRFEYHSGNNEHFLTVQELVRLNQVLFPVKKTMEALPA